MCSARCQNSGVSRRVSQPRTLCGLRSKSFNTRPTWEGEMAAKMVPWTRAAIARWVQVAAGRGGALVAAATIATRTLPS